MTKYYKKPTEIEAYRWSGSIEMDLPPWLQEAVATKKLRWAPNYRQLLVGNPPTTVNPGDYIVQGEGGVLLSMPVECFEGNWAPVKEEKAVDPTLTWESTLSRDIEEAQTVTHAGLEVGDRGCAKASALHAQIEVEGLRHTCCGRSSFGFIALVPQYLCKEVWRTLHKTREFYSIREELFASTTAGDIQLFPIYDGPQSAVKVIPLAKGR